MAAIVAAAVLGCGHHPKPIEMFWPDPPETTRIKFVGMIQSAADVKTLSLREIIAGEDKKIRLHQPMGLAVSDDGRRLYIADWSWNGVFVFDFEEKEMRTIGAEDRAPVLRPLSVALDGQENVYVSQGGSAGVLSIVRVYDKGGRHLRDIGRDVLKKPTGVAIDRERSRLYVVDTGHNEQEGHDVKVFDLEGTLLFAFGRRGSADGEFNFPTYAKVGPDGRVYVVDGANGRVQVFDAEGKFVWKFGRPGNKIGDFSRPKSVALDSFGNIYVTDSRWSNVQIFNQKGNLLLIFGGTGGYPGLMMNPTDIVIDAQNRIYVSNPLTRRVNIYQLVNTTAEDSEKGAFEKGVAPPAAETGGDK